MGAHGLLAHRRCARALRKGVAHGSCSLERKYVHRAPHCAWALCSWELHLLSGAYAWSINAMHGAVGSLDAIFCARSLDTHGSCFLLHTIRVRWASWAQALRLAHSGRADPPARSVPCFIRRPCLSAGHPGGKRWGGRCIPRSGFIRRPHANDSLYSPMFLSAARP